MGLNAIMSRQENPDGSSGHDERQNLRRAAKPLMRKRGERHCKHRNNCFRRKANAAFEIAVDWGHRTEPEAPQ